MADRRLEGVSRLVRRSGLWTACLVALLVCESASAQQAQFTGRWLDEGTDLRTAFREIVADARQATVQVVFDEETVALGTVVDSNGWIITKGSEVKEPVRCRLPDGRELEASNVGYDRDSDLMLLKVDESELRAIRWRSSEDPAVGQWLATVGQEDRPVSVGIVSVARRACPVVRISGVLGVKLEPTDDAARIADIIADSAAAAADLRVGDIVLRVGDRAIDSKRSLIRTIGEHDPGTTLEIAIRRGDAEMVLSATLTHPFGDFLRGIAQQNQMGGDLSGRRTGFPVVLQHDTVLSPEQCGGPVVDLNGDAVGVNIARAGRTESYALPADVVVAAFVKLRSAAGVEEQLANDAAPPAPDDTDDTSLDAGAQ